MSDVASDLARVRAEWHARVAAEYASAAITQHLTLWLIQIGAPPDLIEAGLAIVGDELVHSRTSHDVYVAAGGREPPAITRAHLELARTSSALEVDILRTCLRVFCLGETVAVPLFSHLRATCTEPIARACTRSRLDRRSAPSLSRARLGLARLVDRQRRPTRLQIGDELPALLRGIQASYGTDNPVVASDGGAITPIERAWGVAPPREYAEILGACIARDVRPRFAARGIAL